ncbi:MAG: bifunctional folylpolyglutamate synthase/dihydrofolate synthase [Chitinophagaceae bacterium]|nr:bifunctional folylpolyglutamate synthase/dihydrofolate synthase [Chitinophagaceae bacterium]
MTYEQTINYLFTKLPMYSRIGSAAIKEDITNTIALCNYLHNPQQKFKSIHIAGTNGKGSVSHMLAAILQSAGYKTGLYTSPHLKDFRERIKVNGEMVRKEFVTDFTGKIKPAIEELEPSFFEITVAMAFDYFAEQSIDIAVIETGLGGRLDSTNIITPEISVITNIGWDHMNLLGNSLEKIAFEKAGIIKQNIPVVIGEIIPQTKPVFENAASEKNAPLAIASQLREAMNWEWEKNELIVEVAIQEKTDHKIYHLDLPGIYQTKNLLTVLETCAQLQRKGWKINDEHIHTGLQHAKKLTGLHGRWEIIHHSPVIVLDVAHNADGVRQLIEQIELTDHTHVHIVLGMVKDKEIEKILSLLPHTAFYYFTQAHIPRAIDAHLLQAKASEAGLQGAVYPDVNVAIAGAKNKAGKDDLIIVCGSVFLVGEVQ